MYHVTSSANRESIQEHGLDWSRTGLAVGIAGSPVPEQEGCFLAQDELEVSWFVHVNNTGGPVDVWEVSDVDAGELARSPEGHFFVPRVVPPGQLRLVRRGVPPQDHWGNSSSVS